MINMGCDAIVGGHPHVPQGYEIFNGKTIFYSLGNFCFSTLKDFSSDKWNIGEMLSLVVTKAKLTFKLVGIEYKDDNLNIMDDNRWNEQIKSLNGLLSHDKYMPLVNEICTSKLGEYWTLFNMGGLIHPDKELPKSIARHILNKYDHVHLLNLLQCESHRWCISRGIRIE
jgi:poly-gamma-glutamate synthesis protein (capsule biosynthesis protein)